MRATVWSWSTKWRFSAAPACSAPATRLPPARKRDIVGRAVRSQGSRDAAATVSASSAGQAIRHAVNRMATMPACLWRWISSPCVAPSGTAASTRPDRIGRRLESATVQWVTIDIQPNASRVSCSVIAPASSG